jgi:hypothetical protein
MKSNRISIFRNRDFAGTTSSMFHSITSRVVGEVNDDIRADCRRAGGGLFAEVKSGPRSRAALAAREASTGGASNGGGSLSMSACSGQTGGGRRNLVEWILDAERRSTRRAAWEERCAKVWRGSGSIPSLIDDGNELCLPNAVCVVSSCLGSREDVVPSTRNDFFCTLSFH